MPVVYVVFDVLAIGVYDVTSLPIEARKAILEKIVEGATGTNGHVRLQPVMPNGKQLFEICRERGLEGVVAKRAGSIYRADERSFDWIKVKCELDADLIVVGWTPGESARASMGALDLAAYDGDRLVICGAVGSGLSAATIAILAAVFESLATDRPVAEGKYRVKQGRRHVRPELVVSVRHMGLVPRRRAEAPRVPRHPRRSAPRGMHARASRGLANALTAQLVQLLTHRRGAPSQNKFSSLR